MADLLSGSQPLANKRGPSVLLDVTSVGCKCGRKGGGGGLGSKDDVGF